ncbi:hypothetical protein BDN67DRAFT_974367 [Paxillus ammoniavirescens]|nr:hypothetical protein BDN67DRAFT_974367 [Paxillus ammoniavirescens]
MSSETQSILASIQLNDYISVATAVGYDFILTFANEIEYVWQRPWTWVSTLFVVVRYVGCVTALVGAFFGSTMMPGPVITCRVMNMIAKSAFPVFIGASDFLMILRVYAMYDQSRGMLAILVIYISVMVLVIANAAYIMAEKTYLTGNAQANRRLSALSTSSSVPPLFFQWFLRWRTSKSAS